MSTFVLPPYIGLALTRHGPMLYPSGDQWVGRSLACYGEYSEAEVELFGRFLRPGDTVVEAGANIGALTVPLARMVGETGQVWAFEPQGPIHQVLSANLLINGLSHVRAERVALGEERGSIRVPRMDLAQAANFGGVEVGGGMGEWCPLVPLDAFDLESLRLLKIDVEGAEAHVLRGARQTIARLRPVLYVENDREEKSSELIALIMEMGYRLWPHITPLYNPGNFRGMAENIFANVCSFNVLCLPAEASTGVVGVEEILSPDHRMAS